MPHYEYGHHGYRDYDYGGSDGYVAQRQRGVEKGLAGGEYEEGQNGADSEDHVLYLPPLGPLGIAKRVLKVHEVEDEAEYEIDVKIL